MTSTINLFHDNHFSVLPKSASKNCIFSKYNFDCLKGVLAFVVLFHHLFQNTNIITNGVGRFFLQNMGPWAVGVYFFISGYGLLYSCINKKNYVLIFPRNRILPFYLIIVSLFIVYLTLDSLLKIPISTSQIFHSLTFGGSIVENGWYLQTILFLYIAFAIIFRFFLLKKSIIIMTIIVFFYSIYKYATGPFYTTFVTPCCFVLGGWALLLSLKYDYYIQQKLFQVKIFSSVGFLFSIVAYLIFSKHIHSDCKWIFFIFSNVFFCTFLICIDQFLLLRNKLFKRIGDFSLEIYTLQGLWIKILHSKIYYISNDYQYCLLVFIATLISAYCFHFWTQKIYGICRR